MKTIKAIIFDMDGVLVDAKDWHYEALNRALNLFGHNINRKDHLDKFDGLPTKKKLEMLSENEGLPRTLHKVINDLKQMYTIDLIEVHCRPSMEHKNALSRLKARGYKLGVASNSVRKSVEVMMSKMDLIKYFDTMLSNEDVQYAKPDPEIYITAASNLGLMPEECLVVEDNKNGIASARAAGANLMVVESVKDVCYDNITMHLNKFSLNKSSATASVL